MDFHQSSAYQEMLRQGGCKIEKLDDHQAAFITRMILVPFCSRMILQRVENPQVLSAVKSLARRHRGVVARVAPDAILGSPEAQAWEKALKAHGFHLDADPIAPTRTIWIDLSRSEDALLADMKSKTRYNVRLSMRRGLEYCVYTGKELLAADGKFLEFHTIYSQNCQRIGMPPPPPQALRRFFTTLGDLLFTIHAYEPGGQVCAVVAYIHYGDTLNYEFNGTTEAGRHDFAADLLVWAGMQEGKRRGGKWFDFDGLFDERFPGDEDWKGFSHFKSGFGGQEVLYPGTYIKRWPLF